MILVIEIILVAATLFMLVAAGAFAGRRALELKRTREKMERRLEPKRLALLSQGDIIQKRALIVSLQAARLQERQAVLQKTLLRAMVLVRAFQEARSELKRLPHRFGF